MTKSGKTQSPENATKRAKKAPKKAAPKKRTNNKQNTASNASDTDSNSNAFDAAAFAALWQQKWHEMLQEQGWPEHAAMPNIGQMPFMMPFMMPNMASPPPAFGADHMMLPVLLQRIGQLEYRIMELERKLDAAATRKRKT